MADESFGFMLRRPGPRVEDDFGEDAAPVYLAPDFTTPVPWHRTHAGSDPRCGSDVETDWALSLPHQCGEWGIWDGSREQVLEAAYRFRAELDQAIAAMEADHG